MKKTLGGDRLGSGKKMQVDLHGYERSTFDLGYLWRSTMAPGTLVPFLSEVALPGDTFDINLECDIKTHPTIGPLFGSEKVQLDIFLAPIRLYNSMLHNNALGIGLNMSQVKLPQIELRALTLPTDKSNLDWDNIQINPSCILSYFGIRGIGTNNTGTTKTRQFNVTPILCYWEIYKNYYANKQEEIGAVIHTPAIAIVNIDGLSVINDGTPSDPIPTPPAFPTTTLLQNGTIWVIDASGANIPIPSQIMVETNNGWNSLEELGISWNWDSVNQVLTSAYNFAQFGDNWAYQWRMITPTELRQGKPAVATFTLSNIDLMRNELLAFQSNAAPYVINDTTPTFAPYNWLCDIVNGVPNILSSQEGLALKTYQSDKFNNWLQTEWIDGTGGISEITAIDTSGGSFTIDTLNLSKKVYDMLNRIMVSGGSYDDWMDAVWTHDRYTRVESPMYMGGLIKEIVFQEVVSNAASTDQALGTLAGKGVMSKKHKGGHVVVKVDEPSYIIGIVSITPRLDYSQGNKWDVHLKTIDDLHKPALDEIGFQELITEDMAWWDTKHDGTDWIQKSAGKQPAWINYMTNTNRTLGNFAITNNEMFMTFNRRYEMDETNLEITDLTTYIDPSKFNFIFAETALDAQNYWTQIAVDITARRKMSAKIMPNL